MPALPEVFEILLDDLANLVELVGSETAAPAQSHRLQPVFRGRRVMLDVDVWRLVPITGKEEEPERTLSEYRRHG